MTFIDSLLDWNGIQSFLLLESHVLRNNHLPVTGSPSYVAIQKVYAIPEPVLMKMKKE
ncbi:hypothetical protein [Thioalkalivibrio thiocyanodenitrificans]|uniref:hypothetical protein n=1 Tax=Thioalkalivibrio thiocyanodenitrificans TaxID=243063 RepID=UPI0012E9F5CF|nr:hypothetical protein [Thioalkalivibrio thiocyanodenitrificans]